MFDKVVVSMCLVKLWVLSICNKGGVSVCLVTMELMCLALVKLVLVFGCGLVCVW